MLEIKRIKERVFVLLAVCVGLVCFASAATISDDFSGTELNSMWELDPANAASLNTSRESMAFSSAVGISVSLDLPDVQAGSPIVVSFDLYQGNGTTGSYRFDTWLYEGDAYYAARMNINSSAFDGGSTGVIVNGRDGGDSVSVVGAAGAHLLTSAWKVQTITMEFDTTSGVDLYQEIEGVNSLIASTGSNSLGLNTIDTVVFKPTGVVSWYIDDFSVTYVPEPATLCLLVAGCMSFGIRKKK